MSPSSPTTNAPTTVQDAPQSILVSSSSGMHMALLGYPLLRLDLDSVPFILVSYNCLVVNCFTFWGTGVGSSYEPLSRLQASLHWPDIIVKKADTHLSLRLIQTRELSKQVRHGASILPGLDFLGEEGGFWGESLHELGQEALEN